MTLIPSDPSAVSGRAPRKMATEAVHIRIGEVCVPVLRQWKGGFTVDADRARTLRGYVDLYEGDRHLCRGLAVAADQTSDEMRFEFKHVTVAARTAPLDFASGDDGGQAPATDTFG